MSEEVRFTVIALSLAFVARVAYYRFDPSDLENRLTARWRVGLF
jgi:hypothetical protein